MDRVSRPFRDVEALLEGLEPKTPEALLVDRSGLIQALRRSLGELNEHRRNIAGTPVELETVRQINYWEEVLGWVKELQGRDLIFFQPREAIGGFAPPFGHSPPSLS